MSEMTIQGWLDKIPQFFIPEKATGVNAVIQLHLSGEQGGDWYITIQNEQVQVNQGVAPNPRLTMTGDAHDVLQILSGQMDGMRAFMQGKIKVTGDMGLAMKLMGMFRQP